MIHFFKRGCIFCKIVLGRLDFFTFFITLFLLPFGKKFFLPVLFIWFCLVFISYFFKRDYTIDRFKGLLLLPVILFLFYVVGIFLSTSLKEGLSDLSVIVPLLLLPLLYPYQRESYKENKLNFLWSFVAGCAVASLYYFGYALYRSYSLAGGLWVFNPANQISGGNYFLGVDFSYLIHPSYLALYLLLSLLIIGVEFNRWWKKGLAIKIILIPAISLLLASLVMLQSRAGILGFGLLSMIWLIYLVITKRKYIIGIGIFIAFICFIFLVITKFDRYTNTVKSIEKTTTVGITDQSKDDGTAIRFWIWKSALAAIKEHPIFGVGPSNVRNVLYKEYIKRDMNAAASVRLNAHNQYLETWLGLGIFGLLALLAMLFVPIWVGVKERDWLLVGFICLCCVSFMFESMLERTAGISFFVIFYTLLVSYNCKCSPQITQRNTERKR